MTLVETRRPSNLFTPENDATTLMLIIFYRNSALTLWLSSLNSRQDRLRSWRLPWGLQLASSEVRIVHLYYVRRGVIVGDYILPLDDMQDPILRCLHSDQPKPTPPKVKSMS